MIQGPRVILASSVIAFAFLVATDLCAQVPDPLVANQAPVAGVGHHYIGIGAETVNPADGSLTFDLPIMTPDGRWPCSRAVHYRVEGAPGPSPSGTGEGDADCL
jgi:hypothetical protein